VLRGATIGVKPREQFFLRVNPQVWGELSRFAPDLVVVGGYAHLTMQWAMLWCRLTRTPYLINSESHHRRARGGLLRAIKRLPLRYFVAGAAAGLPAGTLAREYLVSYGGRPDRMFALPNSCDVDRFGRESARARERRAALRRDLGLDEGPVLLYVGRLAPAKGLDTLLRAFKAVMSDESKVMRSDKDRPAGAEDSSLITHHSSLNAAQLLLVGDGEQRAELEALSAALGIQKRVRFAGSCPWDNLPGVYAAADLFVLPSRFEPWGAVVNEAIACGLPIVVTDQVGCAPDLVRPGENGWIVPADDWKALAGALEEALAEPQRLRAMGAASARLAPAWSEDSCMVAFTAAVRTAAATDEVMK
jgi:glycosyltransferase involved in cell wall biosynthesis